MAERARPSKPSNKASKAVQPPKGPTGDAFLLTLVLLANNTGLQAPLTLNVGGLLVAGTLIGLKEYAKRLTEQMSRGMDAKSQKAFEPLFDGWREGAKKSASEENEEPPSFIHLANAKYFVPGNPPVPTEVALDTWRGRLSQIEGWSWGELRFGETPQ